MTSRILKLQQALKETNCEALLLEDSISLFYLTGMHFSAGRIIISPTNAHLLVDGRYIESAQENAPCPTSLLEEGAFEALLKDMAVQTLSVSSEDTSYQRFQQLSKDLEKHSITVQAIDNPVKQLRMIKEDHEIELLKQAGILGSRGFDLVCDLLEEGVSELELAQELEIFWLRQGGKKLAFDPIIAFGSNTSKPHYRASHRKLVKDEAVLIDIGVTLDDYHSDMTRTVFFGDPAPEMAKIYNIVKEAQEAATAACKPGITVGELDDVARNHIKEKGYGEQFSHGLGHGIGLEVHEAPSVRNKGPSKDIKLQPGMVITIEPGIYLPGVGGVRIEDTVVVTSQGHENLTNRPKELAIYN
jgi:Xaa-Pro aminopeptidase